MQPPPRRAKLLAAVRATQNQQLCQLQTKHQNDTELLEDLRSFTNKRAQIEREYSQALLKLATSYLQRKVPNIPEAKLPNKRTIYSVWRTTLDETEKLAKAHLASAEVFQQQISDSAKLVKNNKIYTAKKCFDSIRKMHEEIHQDYVEMEKIKKVYFEEEHMAHCARDKAFVAEEKLKRKKGKIFQSLSSLQRNSSKFSYKREACDTRATTSRNQYLLWIYALNTQLSRYHDIEIPALMKAIDGPYYEKVAEYLSIFCRTELLTCSATQNSYSNVQSASETISRNNDLEVFMSLHPLIGKTQEYLFEPCDEDKIVFLSVEYNAGHFLNNECKKWALCYTKDCRIIKQKNKLLQELLNNSSEQASRASTSESGSPDKQIDMDLKIDEIKDIIRRAETSKAKAWARLESMKTVGINVNEFLQYSDTDSFESQETTDEKVRQTSQSESIKTNSQSESEIRNEFDGSYDSDAIEVVSEPPDSAPIEPVEIEDACKDEEDTISITNNGETVELSQSIAVAPQSRPESMIFPNVRGSVLFPYEAVNADELTIVEQEILEVIGEGDGDGWVKARNYEGKEGFIPQNYIEIENGGEVARSIHPAPVSFSSVNYQVSIDDGTLPNGLKELALQPHLVISAEKYCRSLYDYEATCEEELSFNEGQVIKILKTSVNDVDDGWWEGEIDGKIGLFPSLVVETLKITGEPHTPLDFENMTPFNAPPAFTPPQPKSFLASAQVIITQPTPQVERNVANKDDQTDIGEKTFNVVSDNFEMELKETQQDQYKAQFSSSESDASNDPANTNEFLNGPVVNYHPLVSSPDSPHKDGAGFSKSETKGVAGVESEIIRELQDEVTIVVNDVAENIKDINEGHSGVIITVDTVETPPRSDDEEEAISAEDSGTDTTHNNNENTGTVEDTEIASLPDQTKKEIEAKQEEPSTKEVKELHADPIANDQVGEEQVSPSSESSKTDDSIVEVKVKEVSNNPNDSVEAMDQEEDEEEYSLR